MSEVISLILHIQKDEAKINLFNDRDSFIYMKEM